MMQEQPQEGMPETPAMPQEGGEAAPQEGGEAAPAAPQEGGTPEGKSDNVCRFC